MIDSQNCTYTIHMTMSLFNYYDFLTECAVTVANQNTGSGCNLLKTGNRLPKTPAPLWPSKFVFVILIKYLARLFQYKTVSRIWWPWIFSFPAAFFNVYSHGKPWRHYLIIYHHLRFERFLILHCCDAKLFDDLRLNKTLITTKTFKNTALKSGCFWSRCWFDGAAFVHCHSCHGNEAKHWKQSSL